MPTAKDLATALARGPSEVPTMIERIRYWTEERLLETAGDAHPGSGKTRVYGNDALVVARVLNELVRCGYQITWRHPILTAVSASRLAARQMSEKHRQGFRVYLTISSGGSLLNELVDLHFVEVGSAPPFSGSATASTVLNLSRLLGEERSL
jgi:hypothetical protein